MSERPTHGKRVCLVALGALVAIAALASPALATWGNATYLTYSSLGPNEGASSPHGGYKTTTQKCAVCHAVHNAAPGPSAGGSEVLLRSTIAEACTYCHISPGVSVKTVYNGVNANYTNVDWNKGHNFYLNLITFTYMGIQCTGCHQVHAAYWEMTASEYLTKKILKGPRTNNPVVYDIDAGAPQALDPAPVALTKWCTTCHQKPVGGYYSIDYNQWTHILTQTAVAYDNPESNVTTQVAWKDSTYCLSCHGSEYGTAAWPHYTAGARLLIAAADSAVATEHAGNARQDGVCLRCHRSVGNRGVGSSF